MSIDKNKSDNRNENIEMRKLELEIAKFEHEKQLAKNRDNLFNRHIGSVLTTTITIITIIISLVQYVAATKAKDAEIAIQLGQVERENIQKDTEIELAKLNQERQWKLDIARFVAENKDKIFGGNKTEQKAMGDLMLVTFPPEITSVIFQRLQDTVYKEDEKEIWKVSEQKAIELIQARIYVHITDENQREVARNIENLVGTTQWKIPGIQKVNTNLEKTQLRYFREKEKEEAKQIAEFLKAFKVELVYISGSENSTSIRPRHYELWLGKNVLQ